MVELQVKAIEAYFMNSVLLLETGIFLFVLYVINLWQLHLMLDML